MAESLWSADPPALDFDDADGSGGLTLHTLLSAGVNGTITHIRRWRSVTAPSYEKASLWSRTNEGEGTLLGSGTVWTGTGTTVGAAGWDTCALDTPVVVSAAQMVYAGLTTDRFVSATDPGKPFKSGAIVSGNLTAPADDSGTPVRNGRFNANGSTPAFPDSSAGNCYFVDVVFTEIISASVSLTPAGLTFTAMPLSPVPGSVTVALTPAVLTLTAQPLAPSAGPPTGTRSPFTSQTPDRAFVAQTNGGAL